MTRKSVILWSVAGFVVTGLGALLAVKRKVVKSKVQEAVSYMKEFVEQLPEEETCD